MRKTELIIGLVVAVALALGLIWLFSDNSSDHEPNITANQLPKQIGQPQTRDQGPLAAHQATSPERLLQTAILQEIAERQFSQDPYTEVLSLRWLLNHCINNPGVDETATYYGLAYPAHKQINDSVKTNCDLQQQRYPELFTAFKARRSDTLFKPESQTGRLLRNLLDRNTTVADQQALGRLALLAAIQEENGIILAHLPNLLPSKMTSHLFPINEWLQSQDHKYLKQINQTAINLMSCQFSQGISCAADSALMQLVCAKNPMACGQDFSTWYQNNTLPGMQQDVQTLMAFYHERASETNR